MQPITLQDLQRKSRIRGEEYAADLQAMLDESLPALRLQLVSYDESDEDVAATIRLGLLEVMAGMALKEYANEEDQDDLSIGPLKLGETRQSGTRLQRGQQLEADGWNRLKTWLKSSQSAFEFGLM